MKREIRWKRCKRATQRPRPYRYHHLAELAAVPLHPGPCPIRRAEFSQESIRSQLIEWKGSDCA